MKLSWLLPAVVGASGAVHAAVSSPTASRAVTDTPGIDKDVGLDTSRIVCVTGVSGYVASVLAAHLDERGYAVHGTVRDLDKYLRQPEFDNYSLFEAELLDDASFDAAFASCHVVMHTASPFFRDVEDPQRDLVDPAVNGTLNVLRAAARAPLVDTVVLTSSTAAVGPMQLQNNRKPAHVPIDERDWTDDTTLENAPYRLSKRLAEKAAWQFIEEHQDDGGKIRLAVMNPAFVLGSLAIPRVAGESTWFMKNMLEGGFASGASSNTCFGIIDVHDLAEAHIAAMERIDQAAGKRFVLASSKAVNQLQVANFLRNADDLAAYHTALPTKFKGGDEPFCASYDHGQAQRVLGLYFKAPSESVVEMARDMISRDLVKPPASEL